MALPTLFNNLGTDYLPLIYEELLSLKKVIVSEAEKRIATDERMLNIENVQLEMLSNVNILIRNEDSELKPEDIKQIDASLSIEQPNNVVALEFRLHTEPLFNHKMVFLIFNFRQQVSLSEVKNVYKYVL